MTGRIQPTTLGPSASDEIKSRTGRVRPMRFASAAAMASTGPSAGSPDRRRTATCFDPHARRMENTITPSAHAGNVHQPSDSSHVAPDATDRVHTAATVCGAAANIGSTALDAGGPVYARQAVIMGSATSATRAAQLAT